METHVRAGLAVSNGDAPSRNGNGHRNGAMRISVVVPTRNEAGNVVRLLDELERVLPQHGAEVIFVDDSTDDTGLIVQQQAALRRLRIQLVHRPESERADGLAGAVVRGLAAAHAPWVCVMDADLQHPPALVARMLERAEAGGVDVVVGSRYCGDGGADEFGAARAALSQLSTRAAQLLFPLALRGVSDPMSGFFLVRRNAVALDELRPQGFKILLEILVRTRGLRVAELPFRFGTRFAEDSKASLREGGRYLVQLGRLRLGGSFARFLAVGASGLAVNAAAFAAFVALHLHYLLAALAATQLSTAWNFALAEAWVFRKRRLRRSRATRLASFALMNNGVLLLRGPLLVLLVAWLAMNSIVANVLTLTAIALLRFAAADGWVWALAAGDGTETTRFWYRIHDEVSVESPVRLLELERFRVHEPVDEPTIRVRLGRLRDTQAGVVEALAPAARRIRYDEGLGPLGFGIDIVWGKHVEILASRLLALSPHVLYTNVVEPTLRWCFVRRGYALAHAACIAVDGRAYLVTARTDTGKTTTILRTLDAYPASFVSDDLTLIAPDGRVLTYPKPLTISRHTAAAVKTPLLTRRERIALIFQSRIHSRSGRRFAQLVAALRLPAATINGIVQLIVPPPKYHVERLVPGVRVAREAQIAGFVVIERGGVGEEKLTTAQATATLLENSADAYGFPPYPAIEEFLRSEGARDLAAAEAGIVAAALEGVPALVLRSETMDWWRRLPLLAGLEAPAASSNGHVEEPLGAVPAFE